MDANSDNVAERLLARGRAGDVVLIEGGARYTYAELRRAVAVQAQEVESWNLRPGSRIGLLGGNSFFWVASYLAVMYAGHTVVPFAPVLTEGDMLAKAEYVGCESLLIDERLSRRFSGLAGHMARVVSSSTLKSELEAGCERRLSVARPPAANAVLVFTSGTTGRPRAVCVGHENISANTASIVEYLELRSDDRMLVVLPFSYCFGASLLHTHLWVGGSLRICETLAFPETVIQAIDADSCSGLAGVPSSYQLLLRASSIESRPLPTLRHLQQAGGRLSPSLISRLASAQPHARMFVMYGQTEATARLSYLPPELIVSKSGSVGKGIPGVRLRITDESGADVPPGIVGEIRASGANITHGYWEDPEGTARKYTGGELRTGDLGRRDEDGYIYVVDRSDDFIKSWGYRVSSQEVEDAVLEIPEVSAAAVVGRPDSEAGEAIILFITVRPGAELGLETVLRYARGRLAKHLVPHEICIVPQLPLNANGKVVKSELRKLAAAGVAKTSD